MSARQDEARLGPYRLVRPLDPGRLATRWLALHERSRTSHVVHGFGICHDKAERRRFLSAVESVARLSHMHLLPVEQFSFTASNRGCVITPYTGNQEGLVTLTQLLEAKGGRMLTSEADRALTQIIEAVRYAHERGQHHGPLHMDEVLVDRRGCVQIELYGMARHLGGLTRGNLELVRDEVRSIVEIGYRLVTGLDADEPRIQASRLAKRLDRQWDQWFDAGLDSAGGFDSADAAYSALPSVQRESAGQPNAGRVRVVMGRVGRVIAPARG